jgi:hypothetical protein
MGEDGVLDADPKQRCSNHGKYHFGVCVYFHVRIVPLRNDRVLAQMKPLTSALIWNRCAYSGARGASPRVRLPDVRRRSKLGPSRLALRCGCAGGVRVRESGQFWRANCRYHGVVFVGRNSAGASRVVARRGAKPVSL